MALIDVDHFRDVNKHYGWPTGDRVLRTFANVARANVRATDWIARYGGEEFVIVMPDTALDSAVQAAERVRKAFSSVTTESVEGQRVPATLSIGVALLQDCMDSTTAFVQQASMALLRAKESGRNGVERAHANQGPGVDRPAVDAGDPFDLERFVAAQVGVYEDAVTELRRGRKRSHWMWYVFPQLRGLGQSSTSYRYGITGIDEARAYLAHPVLGPRLLECAAVLEQLDGGRTVSDIFRDPDDVKLRSSLTLFASVAGPGSVFDRLLARYFGGEPDDRTVAMLGLKERV
jgi:diguanylate cyclase (GGDEF)-like protein